MDPEPSLKDLKSYTMLSISIVFLSISAITVVLRVYVRAYMIRAFAWDDTLMLITWALYATFCGLLMDISISEISYGISNPAILDGILTLVIVIFGVYIITTVIFKLSMAIFFLRIVNQRWQRRVIIASVAFYTLFGISWFFVAVFQCGNPALYGQHEAAGTCLPFYTVLRPLNYIHGVLNAVTDWILAIIPIFVVRSAQMAKQTKISVYLILVLGVFGSICSLVRLAYVDVIGVPVLQLPTHAPNYAIVSAVELGLGITAACLATLRPLFSSCLEKVRTGISSSRNKGVKNMPSGANPNIMSGSYVTSGHHGAHDGYGKADQPEDGFVTVTKELQMFSHRPSELEDLELNVISAPGEKSRRLTRTHGERNRSNSYESGERSLLQVV